VVSTSASYLEGARFRSQPGHRIFWQKFSWFFSVPPDFETCKSHVTSKTKEELYCIILFFLSSLLSFLHSFFGFVNTVLHRKVHVYWKMWDVELRKLAQERLTNSRFRRFCLHCRRKIFCVVILTVTRATYMWRHSPNQLIFLIETRCVFFAVGTEFLNIM
jgi:hypothetical protein